MRSASYRHDVAFARCMHVHGLAGFPEPSPSPGTGAGVHLTARPGSPAARATAACTRALSGAGKQTSGTTATAPTRRDGAKADCMIESGCYAPRQFLTAYGIPSLHARGITGHGITVVLPEEAMRGPARPEPAADLLRSVTDIRTDLAGFDDRFNLPTAHVQVMTRLAGPSAAPWLAGVEEVEDTELVHAVAPDATIRELLVSPADVSSPARLARTFASSVRTAVSDGQIMSQSGIGQTFDLGEGSWSASDVTGMNSALEYAARHRVTVIVASGDSGAIGNGSRTPRREVSLPASDPWALAVGGSTLTANPTTGAYRNETAWNDHASAPSASGGGFSRLFARPGYQRGVPDIGAHRGVPDVAGEATGSSGMALAFTAPGGGDEFIGAGGTSAAAPFWAGLIALADQQAGHPLGFLNPTIYKIAEGPYYKRAFHDITHGTNTVTLAGTTITGYRAATGWDPVTGWGTPDAHVLIPLLAQRPQSGSSPSG